MKAWTQERGDLQREAILAFIVECQEKGFTPTLREMSQHTGLSIPGVDYHVKHLLGSGKLVRVSRSRLRVVS